MEHQLESYDSDFLEDGVFAICSCGWKSLNASDLAAANKLYETHVLRDGKVKDLEAAAAAAEKDRRIKELECALEIACREAGTPHLNGNRDSKFFVEWGEREVIARRKTEEPHG